MLDATGLGVQCLLNAVSLKTCSVSCYSGFRKDGPASSWPGPDAKCPKVAPIPTASAENIPRGVRARQVRRAWPQTPFPSYFDDLGGVEHFGKIPGQADYSEAPVPLSLIHSVG